jgi:hypothetical protein
MWPYWALYLLPAMAAISAPRPKPRAAGWEGADRWTPAWALTLLAVTLMVGLRFRVGGDWGNYLRHLEVARYASLADVLRMADPGYMLANWVSARLDWDIYGVNLICASIFSTSVILFCRNLPRPWLAFAVAVPYLVLVLGMGYSRQGVALGLGMLALRALQRHRLGWFVAWVLVGATFHKTAAILLPMAALAEARNRYWTIAWVGIVSLSAYALLLAESVDRLMSVYLDSELQSEGAFVRLAMNALPALVLLLGSRRFNFGQAESSLWRWFAVASLLLLALLAVLPSSTAIDRIALYLLPLQLVVFSHLPSILGRPHGRNAGWIMLVALYYGIVLFVWLNFATHAQYWIPYRFLPLELNAVP